MRSLKSRKRTILREQIVKIDYRKLLMKYIQYIVEMEGTDYLGYVRCPSILSEPEWNELRRLAASKELDHADA